MEHHHVELGSLWLQWNIWYILLTVGILGIYYWYTNKSSTEQIKKSQIFCFTLGMVLFAIAKGSPLATMGHHYLFSFHMLQMSIMYLCVPLLVLIGIPKAFLRSLLSIHVIRKIVKTFTHPLIALVLFNVTISIYHLPILFDFFMAHHFYHEIYHSGLLFTAFMMWWPVVGPLEEFDQLSDLQKVGYIFADGVLLTPACALIIFATEPIYSTYMDAPQLFAVLPLLDDQQLGGIIMKIVQEIVYVGALLYILVRWVRRERTKDKEEERRILQAAGALSTGKQE